MSQFQKTRGLDSGALGRECRRLQSGCSNAGQIRIFQYFELQFATRQVTVRSEDVLPEAVR